jgi:AcrR family transcriptional regulator
MRDDLLAATQRVIERQGVAGVTVRAIIDEAGVAPATLYAYFAGKAEVVEAVLVRVTTQYLAESAVFGGELTGEDLLTVLDTAFNSPAGAGAVLACLRSCASDDPIAPDVRRVNAALVASLSRIMGDAPRTVVPDLEALAELLDIVWDGMSRRLSNGTFATGYERVGRVALQLLGAPVRTPDPGDQLDDAHRSPVAASGAPTTRH